MLKRGLTQNVTSDLIVTQEHNIFNARLGEDATKPSGR